MRQHGRSFANAQVMPTRLSVTPRVLFWLAERESPIDEEVAMTESRDSMLRRRDVLREELSRLRAAIDELQEHHEEETTMRESTDSLLAEREGSVDRTRDEHDRLLQRYRQLALEITRLRRLLPQ
jgi:chromosome segregation ATPase